MWKETLDAILNSVERILDDNPQYVPSEMQAKYLVDDFIRKAHEAGFKSGEIRLGPYTYYFDSSSQSFSAKDIVRESVRNRYSFLDVYRALKIIDGNPRDFVFDGWSLKVVKTYSALRVTYGSHDVMIFWFLDDSGRPISISPYDYNGYVHLSRVVVTGRDSLYHPNKGNSISISAATPLQGCNFDSIDIRWVDVLNVLMLAIDKIRAQQKK